MAKTQSPRTFIWLPPVFPSHKLCNGQNYGVLHPCHLCRPEFCCLGRLTHCPGTTRVPPGPPSEPPALALSPGTTRLFLSSVTLSLQECHKGPCVRCASFGIDSSIQRSALETVPGQCVMACSSPLPNGVPWCIHCPVRGHLGCFQFLAFSK